MAKSTGDQSLTFDHRTSLALRSVISSLALAVGPSLRVSRGGRTVASFGQALVRVSHSALQAKARRKQTNATSGPNCFDSLTPVGPLSSWENRLRLRLENCGSTECVLTWKASVTPQGRPLSRLVPSMRRTDATDCGLWPTARSMDAMSVAELPCQNLDRKRSSPSHDGLARTALHWYPPTLWPTVTSLAPAKNGNNEAGNSAGLVAIREHALWATAVAQPAGSTPEAFLRRKRESVERTGRSMGIVLSDLGLQAQAAVALWATATVNDAKNNAAPSQFERNSQALNVQAATHPAAVFGPTPSMSPEQTEKPGALNPEFVCWLMGFPPEWVSCAPSATQSSRKSQRK